jgi:uncharacterized protein (DUF1015 family)
MRDVAAHPQHHDRDEQRQRHDRQDIEHLTLHDSILTRRPPCGRMLRRLRSGGAAAGVGATNDQLDGATKTIIEPRITRITRIKFFAFQNPRPSAKSAVSFPSHLRAFAVIKNFDYPPRRTRRHGLAHIKPFAAIRYVAGKTLSLSDVIAPPYDVLDEAQKSALQAKHPNNIVTVDCPWISPKTAGAVGGVVDPARTASATPSTAVGPDEVYERANTTLQAWLSAGILKRDRRPAIYPYAQGFAHNGKTYHRRGFICLVRLSPFGDGHVIPHEKTHAGPIEDRLKLMRATGVQLSPIFGLFNDARGEVSKLLYQNAGRPELDGTLDSVRNQLWSVTDNVVENQVIDLMGTKPIYIADGHHRYTTALQYQKEIEQASGGALPPEHPANYCMFVLVGMQNDGLLILPTHRMIGGVESFNIDRFVRAVGSNFTVTQASSPADEIDEFADRTLHSAPPHTFGLYDGRTQKLYQLTSENPDILAKLEPSHSAAWQRLDGAILQRYLLDEVIKPSFGEGKEIIKGYTANPREILEKVNDKNYQIALLLRPTPLHALEELGKAGEVMPQKSTYFFPKLATGIAINPLR